MESFLKQGIWRFKPVSIGRGEKEITNDNFQKFITVIKVVEFVLLNVLLLVNNIVRNLWNWYKLLHWLKYFIRYFWCSCTARNNYLLVFLCLLRFKDIRTQIFMKSDVILQFTIWLNFHAILHQKLKVLFFLCGHIHHCFIRFFVFHIWK